MATRSLTRRCARLTSATPASVVQGFIQTATTARSFHQNTPRPLLDFLAPRLGAPTQSAYAFKRDGLLRAAARHFSSTRARKATVTTFNPQKNDDGTEQKIEITQRAADRLQQLRKKENNPNLALRVEVQSGGCHGFQYVMSLCDLPANISRDLFSKSSVQKESTPSLNTSSEDPNAMSTSSPSSKPNTPAAMDLREDDTVFSYISDQSHANVVMDVFSLDALKGSRIDYEVKLIGAEFKIVDNPAATSSCGCGTSFDIKF
ncbi:[4Fe-4S] proteins maturation [Ciborinia camelliae]|nr:[4Fe-4S] proteins maturation [Ciborinia camelliae]